MPIVTLLTDFGLQDGYPGVMKGVILGIAPLAQIVDLSHNVPPQDILGGALLLQRSIPYFPDGTIHVFVIDPGVGTSRRAIAAHIGTQFFIGPDNGLITLVLENAEAAQQPTWIGELDKPRFWLPEISHTFHGRDIFAPIAGHLAAGVAVQEMCSQIDNPVRLVLPRPQKVPYGWIGEIIHIDHFGNLATNISTVQLASSSNVTIRIKGQQIVGLLPSFGDRPAGSLIALIDSSGSLAVSIVNGNAARLLSASTGDTVELVVNG